MPITVQALRQLSNLDRQQIQRLHSLASHDEHCTELSIGSHDYVYVARFNDKIIASIVCTVDEERSNHVTLHHLMLHPANHNRGVIEFLLHQIRLDGQTNGIDQYSSTDPDLSAYLVGQIDHMD